MVNQQIDHAASERDILVEVLMFRKFSTGKSLSTSYTTSYNLQKLVSESLDKHLIVATLAVLVYEYIVTFRQEIRYIWRYVFDIILKR